MSAKLCTRLGVKNQFHDCEEKIILIFCVGRTLPRDKTNEEYKKCNYSVTLFNNEAAKNG